MASRKVSVLVVDDDVRILHMIQRALELEGYNVFSVGSGEIAMDIFDERTPDLVLLDIMMPGIDGCTVCRRIREFSNVPIIIVTARGSDEEKVNGLDAGADDYITKPFSTQELAARLRAVLRRAELMDEHTEPALCFGKLVVDLARHRVSLGDREINLTATEYRLLSCLARNAGRVITSDQLLERVWGEGYLGETHLLQVNMTRLRHKLGDDFRNPEYLLTRSGIGYMMLKDSSSDNSSNYKAKSQREY